jgi:hypothetical protein
MRSPICTLVDISEIPGTSIPAGRATDDGIREYETNDNNVVKRSHVADYRTPTRQIPSRDRFGYSKVTRGNQRKRVS